MTLPGKFPSAFVLAIPSTRFQFPHDGSGASLHGADVGRGDFDGLRRKAARKVECPHRVGAGQVNFGQEHIERGEAHGHHGRSREQVALGRVRAAEREGIGRREELGVVVPAKADAAPPDAVTLGIAPGVVQFRRIVVEESAVARQAARKTFIVLCF